MLSMAAKKSVLKTTSVVVIVFDWDNTIMASAHFFHTVLQKTAACLQTLNILLKKEIPFVATKKKEEILIGLFGEENLIQALSVFQKIYGETFKPQELHMLPGARELLQKLNDAAIPVAIVSNYTEVGIKQHLDLRGIDYTKLAIVGVDSIKQTKPCVEPGLFALDKLSISHDRTIRMLMIGDGIKSDMVFAKNMHVHLNTLNPQSSCTGILFNSLLSGEPIFNFCKIEKFTKNNQVHGFNKMVVYGYGGLFKNVRNAITLHSITSEDLQEQKNRLRHRP